MNETTHDQIRELLPAYALDALDDAEARLVNDHLRDCAECTQELASLLETLSLLAFSVPAATPAPAVRTALFNRVEQLATAGAATTVTTATSASTPQTQSTSAPAAPRALATYRGRSRGVRLALAPIAAVLVGST